MTVVIENHSYLNINHSYRFGMRVTSCTYTLVHL